MAVENCTTKAVGTEIDEANSAAYDEKYDIEHAAALLMLLGEDIGTPGAERSDLE